MEDSTQPLLLSQHQIPNSDQHQITNTTTTTTTTFVAGADDISPINTPGDFFREFARESKKLWYLAAPAMFTTLCQYSLGTITQTFAGQLSALDLAAISIENAVIAGFSFGIMLGMGSALETLTGQAFGAGQMDMLGVYLQRSWIILGTTASLFSLIYIFATSILRAIGQTEAISKSAGLFALYMIPQLFAYAVNFPMAKFLQAQSKIMVMAVIAGSALVLHVIFSWLFMLKLRWGLGGAAVVLNASWWLIDICQFVYIISGTCGRAWNGFSLKAFQNLWGFAKLSIASAVMICLEAWYYMSLILFAGYLKNAEVAIDALSVCMNILGWTIMASLGMNAAISVRISNELGAGHPRIARFSLLVAVVFSFCIGVLISAILFFTRNIYPSLFSNNSQVQDLVIQLTPLLCVCIIINNTQTVLSGMAIGAGWQAAVAYVNIACYYVFGIPLGLTLSYKIGLGVKGIWIGMMSGTIVQTLALIYMIYKTNWNSEASIAEDRIKKWGGQTGSESKIEKETLS